MYPPLSTLEKGSLDLKSALTQYRKMDYFGTAFIRAPKILAIP